MAEHEKEKIPEAPVRPGDLRACLAALGVHPSRLLGQNFLVDRNILNILCNAAGIVPGDEVLEVGPGLGCLTAGLLEAGARLISIEKDKRLAAYIRETYAGMERFRLIESDALDVDIGSLFPRAGWKWAANLPYAVAARLLASAPEWPQPPVRIVATIQREVAERIAAPPGDGEYGLLAIFLQRFYAVGIIHHVSPGCFWPRPEVQSSIIRLDLRDEPLGGRCDEVRLKEILRTAFSQRRKTLARSLRGVLADPAAELAAAGIAPEARPETIAPEIWPRLAR